MIYLEYIKQNRLTTLLIFFIILALIGGILGYQKFTFSKQSAFSEIDLIFDPEGPFAILSPRRDGNALRLNLKRTSSYEKIAYELSYNAEGIDRGVIGEVNTSGRKGEYEQEILFGTCSKAVCKYDKGVENGTLTLKIQKNKKLFKMNTLWHLQHPDIALGILTSGDGHFKYEVNAKQKELAQIGYSIINDLTGAPKLPAGKQVLGKVYALNAPAAREIPPGEVLVELAENPTEEAKLFRFNEGENKWEEMDTQRLAQGKLSAKANGAGIFAVLTNKK